MSDSISAYVHRMDRTIIVEQRVPLLEEISSWIVQQRESEAVANCVFVCTHNSRRSQFAQVWAHYFASYYRLDDCNFYSAGTEVTACHAHVLDALKRAGLKVAATTSGPNGCFEVRGDLSAEPIRLSSKRYDDASLPQKGFLAIMVCQHAAENCPVVPGAALRCELPFVDPKSSDGTGHEVQAYDASCIEIATEMSWIMHHASQQMG